MRTSCLPHVRGHLTLVRSLHRAAGVVAAGLLLGGCEGAPSILDPRGPAAAQIEVIWWLMLSIATVILAVVAGLYVYATLRFRHRDGGEDGASGGGASGASGIPIRDTTGYGHVTIMVGGVVVPVIILMGLTVYSVRLTNAVALPPRPPEFTVHVVARQWWWEVHYPDHGFVTANEIRIPAGRPVRFELSSPDVIHSFWVPQLQGKIDHTPGKTTVTWLQADQPGVYRGICAEFCGLQHTFMQFLVVVQPPPEFDGWIAQQRRPASDPADPLTAQGAQVFSRAGCINCHAIRTGAGTVGGRDGPDLTHMGSRLSIAAARLENNAGNMGGWILDPQAIKPGTQMPPTPLDGPSLQALLAYMDSLR